MYYYEVDEPSTKLTCCMICFVFVFIILIIAICWTNYDNFENFGNILTYKKETMINVLSGGIHYNNITPNDNIMKKIKELKNKTALIAVLAPWCGYCKKLKNSGILKKVAKHFPVLVVDDKHPQVTDLMHVLQADGFPALGIMIDGQLYPYKGERMEILNVMKSINSKEVPKKVSKKINIPETKKDLMDIIRIHKDMCIMFLAPWCGHCQKIKEDGIIEGLISMNKKVLVITDKNPLTREMGIEGFPTILCVKNGNILKYEGERSVKEIVEFMN